jgi:hypothetical protein
MRRDDMLRRSLAVRRARQPRCGPIELAAAALERRAPPLARLSAGRERVATGSLRTRCSGLQHAHGGPKASVAQPQQSGGAKPQGLGRFPDDRRRVSGLLDEGAGVAEIGGRGRTRWLPAGDVSGWGPSERRKGVVTEINLY